jgi:hypothetical protein
MPAGRNEPGDGRQVRLDCHDEARPEGRFVADSVGFAILKVIVVIEASPVRGPASNAATLFQFRGLAT